MSYYSTNRVAGPRLHRRRHQPTHAASKPVTQRMQLARSRPGLPNSRGKRNYYGNFLS